MRACPKLRALLPTSQGEETDSLGYEAISYLWRGGSGRDRSGMRDSGRGWTQGGGVG